MVPVAEHGASSRIYSGASLDDHCAASEVTISTVLANFMRSKFSRRRFIRVADRSMAMTFAPAAANCMVFPPGAAQRSMTVLSLISPKSLAGMAAEASCTHHAPSSKPGRSVTEPPAVRRSEPQPISVALNSEAQ